MVHLHLPVKAETAHLKTPFVERTLPFVTNKENLWCCCWGAMMRTSLQKHKHRRTLGLTIWRVTGRRQQQQWAAHLRQTGGCHLLCTSPLLCFSECMRLSSHAKLFCMKGRVFSFWGYLCVWLCGVCVRWEVPEPASLKGVGGFCLFLRRARRSDSHSGFFHRKHIHLWEKGGRSAHMKGQRGLLCTGRRTVHGLQCKHNTRQVTDGHTDTDKRGRERNKEESILKEKMPLKHENKLHVLIILKLI